MIDEDISDVLSESNPDTRVVIHLDELLVIAVSICVIRKGVSGRTLIAVWEGGASVVHSWVHAPSRVLMAVFSATWSIALSDG